MHRLSNGKLSTQLLVSGGLGLLFLYANSAWAALPQPSAVKAPTGVIQKAQAGTPQNLIVLFDDSGVRQQSAARRQDAKSPVDTAEILSFKAQEYASLRRRVLDTLPSGTVDEIKSYSHLPMAVLRVPNSAALERLLNNPGVVAIYENGRNELHLAESLPLISQPYAQTQGKTGAGTTVSVLDTGVDYGRPAFGSCSTPGTPGCRVIHAQDFAPEDNVRDTDGHGTNVSGIVLGVAPQSSIAGLDVVSSDGFAHNVNIIDAINWSIANKFNFNIVAMNLSLGNSTRHSVECANSWAAAPFQNARNVGILPVVSAGNNNYPDGISEPACAPGAVRVGAVYDSNVGPKTWPYVNPSWAPYAECTDSVTAADIVACFSNSAPILTVLAPGSVITAAGTVFSGTSMAAPHAAGAIAVLRAANAFPAETLDQTVARMRSTGDPVTDPKNNLTTPRLNIGRAVLIPPAPSTGLKWLVPVLDLILD